MGGVVKSFCKSCNYKQDNLSLGHGFDFTRGSLMPAFCESCDKLQLADMDNETNLCKIHKTPVSFYHQDENLGKDLDPNPNKAIFKWKEAVLKKGNYKCPKCKNFSLQFKDKGIDWD